MSNEQDIPFGMDLTESDKDARGNTYQKRPRREIQTDGSSDNDGNFNRSGNFQNRDRQPPPPNRQYTDNRGTDNRGTDNRGMDNRDRPNTYNRNNNYRSNQGGGNYNNQGGGNYNNQGGGYNRNNYNRDGQSGGNYNNQGGGYNRNNYNRDGQSGGNYNNQGGGYNRNNYNRDGQSGGNYNNQGGGYNRNNYNRDGQSGGNYNNQGGGYNRNNYNRDGQSGGNYNNQGGNYRNNYRDNQGGGGYNRNNNYRDNQGGGPNRNNYRDNQGGGYNRNNYNNRDGQGNFERRDNRQHMNRRPNNNNQRPNNRNRFNKPQQLDREKRPQPRRPRFTPLVKVLRGMGFASPRICVEIVRSGRVFINGEESLNPNLGVNLRRDDVRIDGFNLNDVKQSIYLVINKQKNVAGSKETDDNSIFRQFRVKEKLYFPFGCLEKSTSGLVFATNDVRFKNPDSEEVLSIPIQYRIKINRPISKEEVQKLSDKFAKETISGNAFNFIQDYKRHSWIFCVVTNTKPAIIKAFLKRSEIEPLSFERYSIGSITSDLLQRGMWTRLTSQNVEKMLKEPISMPVIEKAEDTDSGEENENPSFKKRVQSLYRHWFIKQ